jgi:hypothetical protein
MGFLLNWIKRFFFIYKVKKTKTDRVTHIKQLEKELGIIEEPKSKYGCTLKEASDTLYSALNAPVNIFEGFDLGQKISIDNINIENVSKIPGCHEITTQISMTNQDSPYIQTIPGRSYIPEVYIKGLYSSGLQGITHLRTVCNDRKLHSVSVTDIDNVVHNYEGYLVNFTLNSQGNLIIYNAEIIFSRSIPDPQTTGTQCASFPSLKHLGKNDASVG